MDEKKIGPFIAQLRKEKKMTQEDLAEKLIVDRATVSKWERGEYIPNISILLELQKIFDVSINEILYGERKNKDNNNEIDSLPINIMNNSKRKIRRLFIISITIIILLITMFFAYYFIDNYNSIKIFKITAENDKLLINNGLLIISREKSYIRIGDIETFKKNKISKIELYFFKNKKKNIIFSGGIDISKVVYENKFNYNELFKYSDINYIINNLYLKIIFDDNSVSNVKLILKKDFSNNKIFNSKNLESIGDSSKTDLLKTIPKYIKDNFNYNREYEKYYREYKLDNYLVQEEFHYNVQIYMLIKKFDKYDEFFEYNLSDKKVNHYIIKNDIMSDYYEFDYNNKQCVNNSCDYDELNKFYNNFLFNLE